MNLNLGTNSVRIILASILAAGSLLVGVVTARALAPGEPPAVDPMAPIELPSISAEVANSAPTEGSPVPIIGEALSLPLEGGLLPDGTEPLELLGIDDTTGVIDVSDVAPETIGFVAPAENADPAAPDSAPNIEPTEAAEWYIPALQWFFTTDDPAIDPCAGEDDSGVPTDCPPGIGSTVLAARGDAPLPPLYGWIGDRADPWEGAPAYSMCPNGFTAPGAGETAAALYTTTPLTTAAVAFRVHGSFEPWQVVEVNGHPGYHQLWLDGDESDPSSVVLCFNAPRNEDTAYEVVADVIDVFGRTAKVRGVFASVDPTARPQTTARVDASNRASIVAYSRDGGRVAFFASAPGDGSRWNPECLEEIPRVTEGIPAAFGDERVYSIPDQRPAPVGVVDPTFDRAWHAQLQLAPGESLQVCVEVYDNADTASVIGVDRLVLHSRSELTPIATLHGINLVPYGNVDQDDLLEPLLLSGELLVVAGAEGDRCENSLTVGDVGVFEGVVQDRRLWSCSSPRSSLPIRLVVRPSDAKAIVASEFRIPIADAACTPTDCYQASTLHPLALPAGPPIDEGFEDFIRPWARGFVWIRVDYPLAPGPGDEQQVEYLSEEDIDPTDAALQIRYTVDDLVRDSRLRSSTALTILTSRPVSIQHVWAINGSDERCDPTVSEPPTGEVTSASFTVEGLCPGLAYDFEFSLIDSETLDVVVERFSGRRTDFSSAQDAFKAGGDLSLVPGYLRVPAVTISARSVNDITYVHEFASDANNPVIYETSGEVESKATGRVLLKDRRNAVCVYGSTALTITEWHWETVSGPSLNLRLAGAAYSTEWSRSETGEAPDRFGVWIPWRNGQIGWWCRYYTYVGEWQATAEVPIDLLLSARFELSSASIEVTDFGRNDRIDLDAWLESVRIYP